MRVRTLTVSGLKQSKDLYEQLRKAVLRHNPDVAVFAGNFLHSGIRNERTMLAVEKCSAKLKNLPVKHLVFLRGEHEEDNWPDFVRSWGLSGRPFHALDGSAAACGPLVLVGFPSASEAPGPWTRSLPKSGSLLPCVKWLSGRKVATKRASWISNIVRTFGPAAQCLWIASKSPNSEEFNSAWRPALKRFPPLLVITGDPLPTNQLVPAKSRTKVVPVGQMHKNLRYAILDFEYGDQNWPPRLMQVESFPDKSRLSIEPSAGLQERSTGRRRRFDPHAEGFKVARELGRAEGGAISALRLSKCTGATVADLLRRIERHRLVA